MARKSAAAEKTVHRCQACGHEESRWHGRCPSCGEWNAMVEELVGGAAPRSLGESATRASGAELGHLPGGGGRSEPVALVSVEVEDRRPRLRTGIGELDRVLGGGLVPGCIALLGGDPGVGKSTLLLQALEGLAQGGKTILYVSGEESVAQTALRARRLGVKSPSLMVHAETQLERLLAQAKKIRPAVLAVDSIQTTHTLDLDGIPGSVGQVRECAAKLTTWAKSTGTPVIVVGHVTKDGGIAGPKTLEHVVDVVLHFEGEGNHAYRLLRGLKNRFGSTSEVGVFEMKTQGLAEVANPSALFLAERPIGVPGSVVVASADGARPLLVEIQALVAPANGPLGRRTVAGVDANRVALLLAVLAERVGVNAIARDVFVNVAGGARLDEPAVDLGVACAIASADGRRAVDGKTLVFGEVGLAGEVRGVSLVEARLAEARKLGFARVILPRQNRARLDGQGLDLVGVDHVRQALGALFGG